MSHADTVREAMADGQWHTASDLAESTGLGRICVFEALGKLHKWGEVERGALNLDRRREWRIVREGSA